MKGLSQKVFYRGYHLLPHRLLHGILGRLFQVRCPQRALRAAARLLGAYGAIEMDDFEEGPYSTLEEIFLRRLKPDRRPIGEGLVSPVDGQIVDVGPITEQGALHVKGERLCFERLVGTLDGAVRSFGEGSFVVLFLSPKGYHWVHMPCSGIITGHQWIQGGCFPQNANALKHIHRVYERNARVVLQCYSDSGEHLILVLVGASMVSGIHVLGISRPEQPQSMPAPCTVHRRKGEELGFFSLGSTVILLTQRPVTQLRTRHLNVCLRVGEPLFME